MTKTGIISSYINKCKEVLETNDIKKAKELEEEIVSVYYGEIKELTAGLDNYSGFGYSQNVDFLKDIRILKAKLSNYKSDLKRTPPMVKGNESSQTFNINASSNSTSTVNINISFEQTIKNINEISDDILSSEEKQELEDKLASLQMATASKDKEKIWQKLLNVLKFTITKGPETMIAISNFINYIVNDIAPLFK